MKLNILPLALGACTTLSAGLFPDGCAGAQGQGKDIQLHG